MFEIKRLVQKYMSTIIQAQMETDKNFCRTLVTLTLRGLENV